LLSPEGRSVYNRGNVEQERNIATETSPLVIEVPAGADFDLTGLYPGRKCCRLIENVARGKIVYVTASGVTVAIGVTFQLPTAIRPIEAQKILAGTNVGLLVYF
jgi:hypothetical protein